MRGANTPNLLHHRHIPPRTITEKCPVFAPAAVDYVIDRSRTQNWSRLNMPVFHNILSLFPNAVAKVSLRQIRAGYLLPHPCEARRDNYTPSPCPKQAGNQGLRWYRWGWAGRPQGFHFLVGGPRPTGHPRPPGWRQGRLARKTIGLCKATGTTGVSPVAWAGHWRSMQRARCALSQWAYSLREAPSTCYAVGPPPRWRRSMRSQQVATLPPRGVPG